MLLVGYINAVYPSVNKDNVQRSFETKEGKKFVCWMVEFDVVKFGEDGKEYKEELLLEFNKEDDGNQATPFAELIGKTQKVECRVSFSRSEWNGRKFMSVRLYSVSKKEA